MLSLYFQGREKSIAIYPIKTDDGFVLIDCGPQTTIENLEKGLAQEKLTFDDIHALLLTHIHLDHAGAAGHLVQKYPHLKVYVSPIGLPHLADPTRLEKSVRRLYPDNFESLWGELVPVPEANLHPVSNTSVFGLEAFPSPGHASHHICYFDGKIMYAGDAAGVRVGKSIWPVSPPPDVDVLAWQKTVKRMLEYKPKQLALAHYGFYNDPKVHLERMLTELDKWSDLILADIELDAFNKTVETKTVLLDGKEALLDYETTAPPFLSYLGLRRYWKM